MICVIHIWICKYVIKKHPLFTFMTKMAKVLNPHHLVETYTSKGEYDAVNYDSLNVKMLVIFVTTIEQFFLKWNSRLSENPRNVIWIWETLLNRNKLYLVCVIIFYIKSRTNNIFTIFTLYLSLFCNFCHLQH